MDTVDQTIKDSPEICLEILAGQAVCRECSLDRDGSAAELDYASYSSSDPAEFTAHLLKHVSLRQKLDASLLQIELWEEALGVHPRGVRLPSREL